MTAPNVSRVYMYAGRVAHEVIDAGRPVPCRRCGRRPYPGERWYGTSSQDEYDKAAARPLCIGGGYWARALARVPTVGDDLL